MTHPPPPTPAHVAARLATAAGLDAVPAPDPRAPPPDARALTEVDVVAAALHCCLSPLPTAAAIAATCAAWPACPAARQLAEGGAAEVGRVLASHRSRWVRVGADAWAPAPRGGGDAAAAAVAARAAADALEADDARGSAARCAGVSGAEW